MAVLSVLIVFAVIIYVLFKTPVNSFLPPKIARKKDYLEYLSNPQWLYWFVKAYFYKLPTAPEGIPDDSKWCYKKLTRVSRSFSAVILEIHPSLKEAICIFYLVLRGLDTVEDDMKPKKEEKVQECTNFYKHLREPGWKSNKYGINDDERELLGNFDKVISVYSRLSKEYQDVIEDITKQMGKGMADFLDKSNVDTIEDYELYCFYVAGLVGYGLSRLFANSNIESKEFANVDPLSKSMGLFLQKTNITRDYLEDIEQVPSRIFYPKQIWSKWAKAIEDFQNPANRTNGVKCVNDMVTDALKHAPDCLDYLNMVRDPSVFKFCAIPQVMAIATLNKCYNNPDVFRWNVKIAKGEAVEMIMQTTTFASVLHYFDVYAKKLLDATPSDAHNAAAMKAATQKIFDKIKY